MEASTGWNKICQLVRVIGCKQPKPILAYFSRSYWKNTREPTEVPESLKNKTQKIGREREAQLQLVPQSQNHYDEDHHCSQWTTPARDAVNLYWTLPNAPGGSILLAQLWQDGFLTVPALLTFQILKQNLWLTLVARHVGKVSISPVELLQTETTSVSHHKLWFSQQVISDSSWPRGL